MPNEVVIHVKGDASEAEKSIGGFTEKLKAASGDLKKVGAAMLGFGAVLTAGLTLSVKAAAEEEAGIAKLSQALKNVGINYDKVKGSLEANIEATQQKTAIADDQQRDALQKLIEVTGDYQNALSLMPLTLDLAVAKGMDFGMAAEVVGRVAAGNVTILSRYGIQLKEGATATEALTALTQKFGGQAETMGRTVSGQMKLLKANFGDAMEMLGTALLPVVTSLTQALNGLVLWFKNLSPEMQKFIAIGTAVTAGVAILAGGFALFLGMLPSLIAGTAAFGTTFHLMLGPIGLITLAITAAIAAGVLLWKNWDTVKRGVQIAVNAIVGSVLWFANEHIRAFNAVIRGINAFSSAISFGAIPAIKEIAEIQLPRLEVSVEKTGETVKKTAQGFATDFKESAETIKANLQKVVDQMDKFGGQLVEALKARNEKIEAEETASIQKRLDLQDIIQQRMGDALRDGLSVYKENLSREKDALRDAVSAKMELYEKDTLARIGALNAQTIQQLQGYRDQIAILEATTEAEDAAQREKEFVARRAALIAKQRDADIQNNRDLVKKIGEEITELERARIQESDRQARRERIDVIRGLMATIQERAAEVEKGIRDDLAAKRKAAEDDLKERMRLKDDLLAEEEKLVKERLLKLEEDTKNRKEQLNVQLEAVKEHFKSLNSEEAIQAEARKLVISGNNDEIITLLKSYNPQWQDAGRSFGQKLLEGLNSEKENVQKAVADMLAMVGQAKMASSGEGLALPQGLTMEKGGGTLPPGLSASLIDALAQASWAASAAASAGASRGVGFTKYQAGGLVLQPTLALLGEKGPEAVVPLRGASLLAPMNINVTITNRGIIGIEDLDKHIFQAIRDGKRRGAFQGVIP